jgi:hypothetical protein
MSKSKIPSFVPEAPLTVMPPEERQLPVRLALAGQLCTACLASAVSECSECKEVPVVSQFAATIAGSARKEVFLMAADVCTNRVPLLSEALDNFVKPPSTPTRVLPHPTSSQTS